MQNQLGVQDTYFCWGWRLTLDSLCKGVGSYLSCLQIRSWSQEMMKRSPAARVFMYLSIGLRSGLERFVPGMHKECLLQVFLTLNFVTTKSPKSL